MILASNHTSYLDPLALAYLADRRHRRVRFLTKAELFDKKPLGFLLQQVHQIPVVRNSPTAAGSLELAVEALKRGECVAIFPEGTISLDLEPMAGSPERRGSRRRPACPSPRGAVGRTEPCSKAGSRTGAGCGGDQPCSALPTFMIATAMPTRISGS